MTIDFLTIINAIVTPGQFPKIWTHAIMTFILKPNKSPLTHINYTPISLLKVRSKTAGKIITTQLTNLLEGKQLHNDKRHELRANRRTQTAIAIPYETTEGHRLL